MASLLDWLLAFEHFDQDLDAHGLANLLRRIQADAYLSGHTQPPTRLKSFGSFLKNFANDIKLARINAVIERAEEVMQFSGEDMVRQEAEEWAKPLPRILPTEYVVIQ